MEFEHPSTQSKPHKQIDWKIGQCYNRSMTHYEDTLKKHGDLSEEKQVKAGQAITGDMDDEHANFLKTLIGLLDKDDISTADPRSMLNQKVYDAMSQEEKDAVDLAIVNVTDQVRLIENFYRSEKTPDSSPHLQTMIEHLWQMKSRIEEKHDVFKF
jgi:hypothetical protein